MSFTLFQTRFQASKCKTLLKLAIPRIKLTRNRRELQIRQMRKDIAKLLENGQEATARIRVEHIIREENMMAAQEILELYCELIVVRLPIIESQRECPLDLKEAISSVCFAAPRCADLPELLQVQMAFASKYGKEFVAAASELMPNCGVSRQLVELLSVRAPAPEKKLKLLKEIAEEHELDWDPAPTESELFKSHDDLLNGPTHFVSGSRVPLPNEKHDDEVVQSTSTKGNVAQFDSEDSFDELEFPEVPKVSLRPPPNPTVAPSHPSAPHPEPDYAVSPQVGSERFSIDPVDVTQDAKIETPGPVGGKQFVPFITPPSLSSTPIHEIERNQSPSPPRTYSNVSMDFKEPIHGTQRSQSPSPPKDKSGVKLDLQDILAAAKAAAESAERAAARARSAASLAEVRISEFTNGLSPDGESENPFFPGSNDLSAATEKLRLGDPNEDFESNQTLNGSEVPTYDGPETEAKFSPSELNDFSPFHQPQRIPSTDDDTDFTYPNLFGSSKNMGSFSQSPDNTPPRQHP